MLLVQSPEKKSQISAIGVGGKGRGCRLWELNSIWRRICGWEEAPSGPNFPFPPVGVTSVNDCDNVPTVELKLAGFLRRKVVDGLYKKLQRNKRRNRRKNGRRLFVSQNGCQLGSENSNLIWTHVNQLNVL